MKAERAPLALACACALAWAGAVPAHAYIESLYPLQQFIAESDVIAEGVIEKTDAKRSLCTVRITRSIKGRCHYEVFRINLGTGQEWHPDAVLPHLVVGAPAVIFYNAECRAELYLNRFFLQLSGDPSQPVERAWWTFTHIEVHCNRTYNGTTEELSRLLHDVQAGRAVAPPPDTQAPVITKESIRALPRWGEPATAPSLPAPFIKRDPRIPRRSREPENPPGLERGLVFQYYEGRWSGIPNYDALTPAASGVTERFDLSRRKRDQSYAIRFTGYIEIPREGTYHFYTVSREGSKLLIGKEAVVSNDGLQAPFEACGDAVLKAGRHAIALQFYQSQGTGALDVYWEGPDLPKQPVPASALSHTPSP